MSQSRSISLSGSPERSLFVTGIAILLCLALCSGCTQPVIPSPGPASTTSAPAATTPPSAPLAPSTVQVTQKGADFLTYTNTQYGFSLSYPSGWSKQENTASAAVVFTSPSTGMGDVPAVMRVVVDDLSANPMSLEQYKAAQLAKKKNIDNFNLIYDQAFKGVGFSGWKIAYTGNMGYLTEWVEVYAVKGNLGYTLSFSSKEDKYAGFVVQMDTMFKTFMLTY
jgi:hypothetical protein